MDRGPEQTFFQRRHTDGQQTHEQMLNITNHQRNANQNYNEIPPHSCQMAIIKKNKSQGSMRMQRKGNPRAPLVGLEIGAATMENSLKIIQKIENRTAT